MSKSQRSDLLDLDCQLHTETERALLVSNDGKRDNAVWVPKSQIEYRKKYGGSAVIVELTMPEWLAIEKRLV